jgi:hypothetical protein
MELNGMEFNEMMEKVKDLFESFESYMLDKQDEGLFAANVIEDADDNEREYGDKIQREVDTYAESVWENLGLNQDQNFQIGKLDSVSIHLWMKDSVAFAVTGVLLYCSMYGCVEEYNKTHKSYNNIFAAMMRRAYMDMKKTFQNQAHSLNLLEEY